MFLFISPHRYHGAEYVGSAALARNAPKSEARARHGPTRHRRLPRRRDNAAHYSYVQAERGARHAKIGRKANAVASRSSWLLTSDESFMVNSILCPGAAGTISTSASRCNHRRAVGLSVYVARRLLYLCYNVVGLLACSLALSPPPGRRLQGCRAYSSVPPQ